MSQLAKCMIAVCLIAQLSTSSVDAFSTVAESARSSPRSVVPATGDGGWDGKDPILAHSLQRPSPSILAYSSRREVLRRMAVAFLLNLSASAAVRPHPADALSPNYMKSYSSNARNLDRISAGDMSGGSMYDNNPSNAKAARRRAMVGCKIESVRKEVAKMEGSGGLAERDCNLRVMEGNTELVLSAMRELECPSCPYGVKGG